MRPAMGTLVHVGATGPADVVEGAIEAALDAIGEVEGLMSFHDPQSELSRLNREAARAPQIVHPWTFAVLRRASKVAAASDGLFDVAIAPLLVREGLLPGEASEGFSQGDWRHLSLAAGCQVSFRKPMALDLGGIAKGFAIDAAIHALRRAGCMEAVVNAGGDLRRYGSRAHPVHLRRRDGLVTVAQLRHGAIATSAPHGIHEDRLAQPLGSIFDPRTRHPWAGNGAVMVAAPTCVIADALTKVAALAGPSCEPLLARFGARGYWDDERSVTSDK